MKFVSFGSDWRYRYIANRQLRVARKYYPEAWARVYSKQDLPPWIQHYARTFPRGFGYWIWKAWILSDVVDNSETSSLVVYLDARSGFPAMRVPWIDSLARDSNFDMAIWQSNDAETSWTSADLLSALCGDHETSSHDSGQYYATFFGLRVNDRTRQLMHDWWNFQRMNASLVRAENFVSTNYSDFKENRWDQSVFSLMVKRYLAMGLNVLQITDDEVLKGQSIVPHASSHPDIFYPFTHGGPGRKIKVLLKNWLK